MTRAKARGKDAQCAPKEIQRSASETNSKAKQPTSSKRKTEEDVGATDRNDNDGVPARSSKRVKTAKDFAHSDANSKTPGVDKSKIERLLSAYGALPLQGSKHIDLSIAAPETILALV